MKRFSFFEVPSDYANDILTQLSHATWNGNKVNTEISQVLAQNHQMTVKIEKKEAMVDTENSQLAEKEKTIDP